MRGAVTAVMMYVRDLTRSHRGEAMNLKGRSHRWPRYGSDKVQQVNSTGRYLISTRCTR